VKSVVGIFRTRQEATKGANLLQTSGFDGANVILLACCNESDIEAVPTEDAEQPGMGKAIGSVVGGAMGLSAGAMIGSFLLPGIGLVMAVAFGAAAGGVGGAVAGGVAGRALENLGSRGVPKDEIFFYEDALRQGRAVVVGLSDDDRQIETGREVLEKAGAETLDAARDKWWIGLRDAEEAVYSSPAEFKGIEAIFQRGFAAALEPQVRGRSLRQASAYLKESYPDCYNEESFRRGFERGRRYYEGLPREEASR
jgi:hypothetical protein